MARATVALPAGGELVLEDKRLDAPRAEVEALGTAAPVRLAFAATHLVLKESYRASGHSPEAPARPDQLERHVDWESTLALRARLDRLGLGIAEAMDTSQRFEIGWPVAAKLIEACGRLAPRNGFIAGAGVDHLDRVRSKTELVDGVVHQARFIQRHGGWPIVLPLVWLAEQRASEDEYVEVYGAIVRGLECGPLFLHWLGEAFHPALRGYFPGRSLERVMALDPGKLRGVKLSLLDARLELGLRRALGKNDQVLLTGDDLHFADLIRGGDVGAETAAPEPVRWTRIGDRHVALGDFSHALLGVLDAVAAPTALALRALAHGRSGLAMQLLRPCEALGRKLFEPPVRHYKAGLAFLAWLNGLQPNTMLVNREERARGLAHLHEVARLASRAGAIEDAGLAARRLATLPSA